jgi:hypothetical protein
MLFRFSIELKLTFALLFLELSRVNRTMARVPRETSNVRLYVCLQREITVLFMSLVIRVLIEVITD